MLTNAGQILTERAKASPDMEAVVDVATGVRYDFREMNLRTNRLATTLLQAGFRPGNAWLA